MKKEELKWKTEWKPLFDALFFYHRWKTAASRTACRARGAHFKAQSSQRGFKFQKEVRRSGTQHDENHFCSSVFRCVSSVVLAVLLVLVIYTPSKSFPSWTITAKSLFIFLRRQIRANHLNSWRKKRFVGQQQCCNNEELWFTLIRWLKLDSWVAQVAAKMHVYSV